MDAYHPRPPEIKEVQTVPHVEATPAVKVTMPTQPAKLAPATPPALDTTTLKYMKTIRLNHFRSADVPWRSMGQYKYRIIEDGSLTQDRLSIVESLIPPKSHGPIFHFHEMHDECFYVTQGVVRFHSPGSPPVDAKVGDMVVVPTRMPHRFSNPFGEEAKFVSTNTPSHYARYFYYLEYLIGEGNELTPEVNKEAMRRFATVPLTDADLEVLERELGGGRYHGNGAENGANGYHVEEEEDTQGWKILD
jgi:mannose-6-phosphate isomerase-like protein (cupin superfamily)